MKKKPKTANEVKFLNGKDSKEEVYVEWYLQELKDAGIIKEFWYHPEVYQIADNVNKMVIVQKKTKSVEKITTFKRGKTYKPDFRIQWNFDCGCLNNVISKYNFISDHTVQVFGDGYFYSKPSYISDIDVKPKFSIRDSDEAKFSLIQSVVLCKFQIFVQKVEFGHLFSKTFTPQRFFLTDSGRQTRKINWKPITLQEFLINSDSQKEDF